MKMTEKSLSKDQRIENKAFVSLWMQCAAIADYSIC